MEARYIAKTSRRIHGERKLAVEVLIFAFIGDEVRKWAFVVSLTYSAVHVDDRNSLPLREIELRVTSGWIAI
jgi:hypothetical protein